MTQRTRRATAADAAGLRPDSTALLRPAQPPCRASTRRGRGGGAPEGLVRRSDVAPCLTCGICGGLLRDATAISECLDAFCRKCIYDKLVKEDIKCCPTCGVHLGRSPLEKLRSKIFPAKRRKVVSDKNKKRNEKVSAESTLSSVVDIVKKGSIAPLPPAVSQIEAQKIDIEVIDEADEALVAQDSVYESSILNLAPVGRDALSRIRCRDFYSACHLSPETGALIVWQPPPILEEMVAHDQLAPRQDPQTSRHPATSDTEYQRQASSVEMNNTSAVAGSSFHDRITVQDDENLMGDIHALFSEIEARTKERYGAYVSKLKAENSKLIKELENERAALLERTRILEERHQRELENERAAAAAAAERSRIVEMMLQRELENEREAALYRTRILEERHQRELENERAAAAERTRIVEERLQRDLENERDAALVKQKFICYSGFNFRELENGRAEKQALVLDILERSEELATLKYYSNMLEFEKTDLEHEVERLRKDLDFVNKKHEKYVRQVKEFTDAVQGSLNSST
nr:unnamed protein product [Digitaria exilis]